MTKSALRSMPILHLIRLIYLEPIRKIIGGRARSNTPETQDRTKFNYCLCHGYMINLSAIDDKLIACHEAI